MPRKKPRADLLTAQANLQAATERLAVVNRSHVNQSNDLMVQAPISGVVEAVSAQPRTDGCGLGAARHRSRAPIVCGFVCRFTPGDMRTIDPAQGASVLRLGEPNDASGASGPPRCRAAVCDAVRVSDRFDVRGSRRVCAEPGRACRTYVFRGKGTETAIVVPHSALFNDIHGGTWVYVRTAPHVFARQRVEVHDVVSSLALLTRGPDVNTRRGHHGAAELYGVEFGAGK